MRLHDIGLQLIFDVLTPSAQDSSPTLYRGPTSLWCQRVRTWKAVTLVCRRWNSISTRYLYQSVALRRVAPMVALVRTLKDNVGFCEMIRHLTISCFVPEGWDHITNECISYLLTQCSNLRALSLLAPFTEWLHATRTDGMRRFEISNETIRSANSITTVSYCYMTPDDVLPVSHYHVFSSLPNIVSLMVTMDIPTIRSYLSCLFDFKQEDLDRIRAQPSEFQDLPFVQNLDHGLKHFRVDGGLWFRDRYDSDRLRHLLLFQRFSNLHLAIDTGYYRVRGPWVYVYGETNTWEGVTITGQLDVWTDYWSRKSAQISVYPICRKQGLRFLDGHLKHFLPNLPFTFPPDTTHTNHNRRHDLFGMYVEETPDTISFCEDSWDDARGANPLWETESCVSNQGKIQHRFPCHFG